jgi:hypothetical protein
MKSSVTLILTFASLLSVQVTHLAARTWYIKADGTGDAPTIQAGVDSAAGGDTVLVGPGVYSDTTPVLVDGVATPVNVILDKSVSIIGAGGLGAAEIDGVHSSIGIYIEGADSNAVIEHLKIHRRPALYGCPDLLVDRRTAATLTETSIRCVESSAVIRDNVICDDEISIHLLESPARIIGNEFFRAGEAIRCDVGSDAEITDNVIHDCRDGITCMDSSPLIRSNRIGSPPPSVACNGIVAINASPHIVGNEISWMLNYGIDAYVSNIVLENNVVSNHTSGLLIQAGSAVVRGNLFRAGHIAIFCTSSVSGIVENNTIDDWGSGVRCELGAAPLIRANIISRVGWGIQCVLAAPVVECNDIYDVSGGLYLGECEGQNGINGNFSADPEYCGINDSGNYFLQRDSPCAPGNHPDGSACGLIGARDVNCGKVAARDKSWGNIKTLYK